MRRKSQKVHAEIFEHPRRNIRRLPERETLNSDTGAARALNLFSA